MKKSASGNSPLTYVLSPYTVSHITFTRYSLHARKTILLKHSLYQIYSPFCFLFFIFFVVAYN